MKKTDAETILDRAMSLFHQQGYKSTSMADIGKASGLLKGSIYHHFPSKEAILVGAIDRLSARFEREVFAFANNGTLSEKQKLDAMVTAMEDYFIQNKSCVMAHLSMEAMQDTSQAKEQLQSFFRGWHGAFTTVLTAHYGIAAARQLAEDVIAQIEGAVLWLHVFDDPNPLRRMCESARKLL